MIYVLSGKGTINVAGVIRVNYPANSTLVVKGTGSGKQFAKDTNATSSAKAYIFLAPIGNASYTLTATNTAGKTVSNQVYVAKDQVQSVTLNYALVLFDAGSYASVTGGWSKSGNTLSISATRTLMEGATDTVRTNNKISVSGYSTLHFQITSTSMTQLGYRRVGLSEKASGATFSYYKDVTGTGEVTVPISSATTSLFVRMALEAHPRENGQSATTSMVASKVWLT